MHSHDRERTPTRLSAAVFAAKAALLQCQRGLSNLFSHINRHPQTRTIDFTVEVARSTTALWTDPAPTEMWYQRGKVQNLRVASARLDRIVIPAGEVFSFWAQVGRASRFKGYTRGRMLQEGCLIPAIGGGLCQLSNALYQVALSAGCEMVERHAHSRIVPGSATASQRDATVAWNYIDLRFRAIHDLRLVVRLTASNLDVALFSKAEVDPGAGRIAESRRSTRHSAQHNTLPIFNDHACESCGQVTCFRSDSHAAHLTSRSRKAFLLDGAWPEFARYVEAHHGEHDSLAIPLDGVRWNRRQYAWPTQGFAHVHTAQLATLLRSIRSRRLAAQGAARQRALLQSSHELAARLAHRLDEQTGDVCVSQNLLPFLWESGVLGGRRLSVLCTQLPLRDLQAILDRAFQLHLGSKTLNDFRAEDWLVEAESEALHYAERIITPHRQVGALFSDKSQLLDWEMPERSQPANLTPTEPRTILYPCSTLGRKGAYELREALRGVNARLLLGGAVIEDSEFWRGINVAPAIPALLNEVTLVVQPSIVDSQPRALLSALANGIHVITTESSGLPRMTGLSLVEPMNATVLREAILRQL
jgi:hypothetical protein